MTLQRDQNAELVWYACYGSNINEDRFLVYIQGGNLTTIPNSPPRHYHACPEDIEPPKDAKKYIIHRQLYFAQKSSTWNERGVAFIHDKKNKRKKTYARIYLISKYQFNHLFASENTAAGKEIRYDRFAIDYNRLNITHQLTFTRGFYNKIILLEKNHSNYPVYTFTSKNKLKLNPTSKEYIECISKGIIKVHKPSKTKLKKYFLQAKTGLFKRELRSIIPAIYGSSKH